MIILNRRQLTEALRNDWNDHVEDPGKRCEDSIIYRYFENTRNLAARRIPLEETDKYIKGIDRKQICGKYGNYTIRKACEYRRDEIGEEAYRSVCDDIRGTDRTLLRRLVTNFFRNETVTATRKRDDEKPGYIDILDLARYYRDMTDADGEAAACAGEADKDPEYVTKCEELYEEMKKRETMAAACLPLMIDRKSGAGVFIFGSDYFPSEIEVNRNCYPGVLYWGEVGDIDFVDPPESSVPEDSIYTENLQFSVEMYPKVFPTVTDAFGYWNRITSGEVYSEESPLYVFRSGNVGFPMERSERYREFEPYFEDEWEQKEPSRTQKAIMDQKRDDEDRGIAQMHNRDAAKEKIRERIKSV